MDVRGQRSHERNMGLHPELRSRLHQLGIGLSDDLATYKGATSPRACKFQHQKAQICSLGLPTLEQQATSLTTNLSEAEGESEYTSGGGSKFVSADPGFQAGSDGNLDELLLQLDDLDARSKALQRQAQRDEARALREDAASTKLSADKSPLKEPVLCSLQERSADHFAAASVVEAIVRQHPLQGLSDGRSDFKRHTAKRRDRPPLPPAGPPLWRNSSSPCSASSPSSARGLRLGARNVEAVVLPQLKPSASAPGLLQSASWLRNVY